MKTQDKLIKAAAYAAFAGLILLAHGCGKTNSSGKENDAHNGQSRAFLECSRASTIAYCTNHETGRRLSAYDFYDYYCYQDYLACLEVKSL